MYKSDVLTGDPIIFWHQTLSEDKSPIGTQLREACRPFVDWLQMNESSEEESDEEEGDMDDSDFIAYTLEKSCCPLHGGQLQEEEEDLIVFSDSSHHVRFNPICQEFVYDP
jgi:hypothetical protein